MTPERARELLGGLATGILTPEERQTLFEAALHDQTLFNEVADELEFGAFLQDAGTRAQLANRIEVEPVRRQWWALRPRWLALSGVMAASLVVFFAVWQQHRPALQQEVVNDAKSVAPEQTPKPAMPPATAQAPASPQAENALREDVVRQSAGAGKPKAADKTAEPADTGAAFAAPSKDQKASAELAKRREEARKDAPAQPAAPAAAPAPGTVTGTVGGVLPAPAPQVFRPMDTRARDAAPPPPPPSANAPRSASAQFGNAAVAARSAPYSSIAGTVRDASGAPVPNAAIQILNTATNETTKTTSNLSGYFGVAALPAGGPYTVTAQASGFKKEEKSGITLASNTPAQVDIPLQVGLTSETVEVTGGQAMLDRASTKPGAAGQQIAVLNFSNGASRNQSGQQVADQLSSQLQNSGQNVIDRGAVQQAQQAQQQASASQVPTNKEAADLGRRLGADAVIVGSVEEKSQVAIKAKVIETKKAQPLANVAASGPSLQGATNQIGLKLESQLNEPVEGTVRKLESGLLSINLKPPGLARVGARLEVFHGKQKIGDLVLTAVNGRAAAGKYSGTIRPRPGDRVASPH